MEAATVVWFAVLGLSAEERVGLFSIDVLLVFASLEHMQTCMSEFAFEQHKLIGYLCKSISSKSQLPC